MLCREYRIGSTGDLLYTLATIRQFGITNQKIPRSFVLGAVTVDYDEQQSSSDEAFQQTISLEDTIASLERDGDAVMLSVNDGRREFVVRFRPVAQAIRVQHDTIQFGVHGTGPSNGSASIVIYR